MLASSHAFWTARAVAGTRHSAWVVTGSVLPDLPAVARGAWLLAHGTRPSALLDPTYHRPRWRELHLSMHTLWGPAALALSARESHVRALLAGWLGHLAVDYLTHNDDAWGPLWPVWHGRWRSPVSYWDPDHHAVELLTADLVGTALATARRPTRLGVLAVAATALALGRARGRAARRR